MNLKILSAVSFFETNIWSMGMLTVWSFQQSQWHIASKAQLMLSRVMVHKWESDWHEDKTWGLFYCGGGFSPFQDMHTLTVLLKSDSRMVSRLFL